MSRSRQQADEPQSLLGFEWCVCVKIDVLGAIKKYGVCACNKTCSGQICACNTGHFECIINKDISVDRPIDLRSILIQERNPCMESGTVRFATG